MEEIIKDNGIGSELKFPFLEIKYIASLSTRKQFEKAVNSNLDQYPLFIPPNLIKSVFCKTKKTNKIFNILPILFVFNII